MNNPYAPPKANLERGHAAAAAPELWNPNAAANWSLLFTPIFGAYLHTKNWEALGEAREARASRTWFWVSVVLIAFLTFGDFLLPFTVTEGLARIIGFGLLLSWYFTSARKQAKFVAEHFGKAYPRRKWGAPLLAGIGLYVALFVVLFAILMVLGDSVL